MATITRLKPKTVKPRGETIRTPGQGGQHYVASKGGISATMAIFLVGIAIIADLVGLLGLIPVVGTLLAFAFGVIFGAILWTTYFALGARSANALATMAISYLAELVPVISFLPFYTIAAILTYLIMNPQIMQKIGAAARFLPSGIGQAVSKVQTAFKKAEKATSAAA